MRRLVRTLRRLLPLCLEQPDPRFHEAIVRAGSDRESSRCVLMSTPCYNRAPSPGLTAAARRLGRSMPVMRWAYLGAVPIYLVVLQLILGRPSQMPPWDSPASSTALMVNGVGGHGNRRPGGCRMGTARRSPVAVLQEHRPAQSIMGQDGERGSGASAAARTTRAALRDLDRVAPVHIGNGILRSDRLVRLHFRVLLPRGCAVSGRFRRVFDPTEP